MSGGARVASRKRARRWWAALLIVPAVLAGVAACSSKPPASDAVVAAVTAADDRAESVTADERTEGLGSGWDVTYLIPAGETVSAEQLSAVLLAIRGVDNPSSVSLIVEDSAGRSVDLGAAADELGISWTPFFSGLSVSRSAIDSSLG